MYIRDYISAAAFVISCLSLLIAVRSAGFSRRVKLAEVRAAILAKVSEAAINISKLRRAHAEFVDIVGADADMRAMLDMPEIDVMGKTVKEMHEEFSRLPLEKSIHLFEEIFHKIGRSSDEAQVVQGRLDHLKAKYVRERGGG